MYERKRIGWNSSSIILIEKKEKVIRSILYLNSHDSKFHSFRRVSKCFRLFCFNQRTFENNLKGTLKFKFSTFWDNYVVIFIPSRVKFAFFFSLSIRMCNSIFRFQWRYKIFEKWVLKWVLIFLALQKRKVIPEIVDHYNSSYIIFPVQWTCL